MTDLAARADAVIRAFYRTFALSVGGRVVERDGVVACLGVHPSPIITNTAWRSDPSTAPSTVLRTIDDIYREAGFVGSLLTSRGADADLEAEAERAGRHVVAELPVMIVERGGLAVPSSIPPGARLRAVDPVDDLEAFRTVLVDGFFEDEDGRSLTDATFATPSSLSAPGAGVFIADLNGRPSAVAGAWPVGPDAGIGWVATIPAARRRGLGGLVTARAVAHAFGNGAEFAVLEASPSGHPVYARLGFSDTGHDRIWEPAAD